MSKNTRWSDEDMKKAGLVQGPDGNYVPVKSLVAKGKVSKLPLLSEGEYHEAEDIGTIAPGERIGDFTVKDVTRHSSGLLSLEMRPNNEKKVSKLPPLNVKRVETFTGNPWLDAAINIPSVADIFKAFKETGNIFVKSIEPDVFELPTG